MGRARVAWFARVALVAVTALPLMAPLVPSAAHAQPAAAEDAQPSAADKETARSLMDEGVDREEAKDFTAALKAYQGAHALVRLPMTGLAVARMQAALGLLVEALDMAAEVKQLPVRAGEGPAYAKARAEAEALAGKVFARTPSIQVTVVFAPGGDSAAADAGKEISIDGVVLPAAAASLPRKVNPGKHRVAAIAPGYEKETQDLTVPEGSAQPVTLSLKPIATGGAGTPLQVGWGPNGNGGGKSPPDTKTPPDAGGSGGLSPLVYIGFGVGAVGIVVGSVTGAISLSQTSDLREKCDAGPCPSTFEEDRASANTMANVSNVSFALGVAGAAAGVVGIFLSGGSRKASEKPAATGHVRVMPAVGPGGVSITGTF